MTKIFKSSLDFEALETKLSNAAWAYAQKIIFEHREAIHEKVRNHHYYHEPDIANYWNKMREAYQCALLEEVSEEIEQFAVELMKRKAAEWGQAAKAGED